MSESKTIAVEYDLVLCDHETAKRYAVALRSMIDLLCRMEETSKNMPERINIEVEQGGTIVKFRASAPCYSMFDKLTDAINNAEVELKDI